MKRFLVEETRFGYHKTMTQGAIVIEIPEGMDFSSESLQEHFEEADHKGLVDWDGEIESCEDSSFYIKQMTNEEFESYVAAQSGCIMKEIKSLHKKLENLRAELVYTING